MATPKLDERRAGDRAGASPSRTSFLRAKPVYSGISRTARADTRRARRRARRRTGLRDRSSSAALRGPRPGNNRAAAPLPRSRHHSGAIRSGPSARDHVMHQPPPHEPPRQPLGRGVDHRDRLGLVEQALRPRCRRCGPADGRAALGLAMTRPPLPTRSPARATWLARATGRRTCSAPSLTVSRSTSRATSSSGGGPPTSPSCAASSGFAQLASSAKASKPKPGSIVSALSPSRRVRCAGSRVAIAQAARRHRDLAIDAIPGQHQPPRAQPPRLQLRAPGRAPAAPAPGHAALGSATGSASRSKARGGGSIGAAVSGSGRAPQHPVERVQWIVGLAKPPRQARRGTPASAPMVLSPSRSSVRTTSAGRRKRGHGQGGEVLQPVAAPAIAKPRQCPRCPGGRRHRHPRRQSKRREPRLDVAGQRRLAAEQMRHPAGVEPKPIVAVDLDQRRPARGPARQPLDQCAVAVTIGRHRDQSRVERARIGQPHPRTRARCPRRLGHRRQPIGRAAPR